MKLKNNKGFVVTVVLYFLFIVYLALIANLLALMSIRRQILDKMKREILNTSYEEIDEFITYKDTDIEENDMDE